MNEYRDEAPGFFILPEAALFAPGLLDSDRVLLCVIKRLASAGPCYASVQTLAAVVGRTARSVQESQSRLEEAGMIRIERVPGAPNRITALAPAAAKTFAEALAAAGVNRSSGVNPGSGVGVNPSSGVGVNQSSPNKDKSDKDKKTRITPLPPADDFELFWRTYPHYGGRSSKAKTKAAWERAIADRTDPAAIFAGLHHWLGCETWKKQGGDFVMASERWLRDRRWLERPKLWTPPAEQFLIAVATGDERAHQQVEDAMDRLFGRSPEPETPAVIDIPFREVS